ncbi:phage terminase large subunit [Thiolapillus sp.]|uniref:phage terminase large subunit n=1 Tax=Thiolapillus sp. TaxID=2017437 RepID=UPI003AF97844
MSAVIDRVQSLLTQKYATDAQQFYAYRRMIHPDFVHGWFPWNLSNHLENFYREAMAGSRPVLIIMSPPQHGKSTAITDFASWIAGINPSLRTIYATYSEKLGIRANVGVQRIFTEENFKMCFPTFELDRSTYASVNRGILEYGGGGYFRNATVAGAISGETADIGIIDDPVKGRKEANSETQRETIWDWFTNVFLTRMTGNNGICIVSTRWHVDDLIGRVINAGMDNVKVVTYKALSDSNEALFPELKDAKFLQERKNTLLSEHWEALYQSNPQLPSGNFFKSKWWRYYEVLPRAIHHKIITADTAQKPDEKNDYTVFQCWGKGRDGIYLIDQFRDRLEAPDLEPHLIAFFDKHRPVHRLVIEDASSGSTLIQKLRRDHSLPLTAINRRESKDFRATNSAPHVKAGNVMLPKRAPWLSDYLAEFSAFNLDDSHLHDDQVDCTMDAIEVLLHKPYNIDAF